MKRRTWRGWLVWMYALEEGEGVVDHVGFFCELVLRKLELFLREHAIVEQMDQQRDDQMPVQVRNQRLRQISVRHFCVVREEVLAGNRRRSALNQDGEAQG